MNPNDNGNGNGGGNGAGAAKLKPPVRAKVGEAAAMESKESGVQFDTSDGASLRGKLARVARHAAIFELYNPNVAPRLSEVLTKFTITVKGKVLYSGRAVVRSVVNTGLVVVCEAKLEEADWAGPAMTIAEAYNRGNLNREFRSFLAEWQKSYIVLPEFKIAIADLQMILLELRLWLDKIETEIDSQPIEVRAEIERMLINDLQDLVLQAVGHLLEKFELIAKRVGPDARPAHIAYMQHQIHPFVLSAPFIHRTFFKPLGYAGDYEMVNMMVRNPYEGKSFFAKILNYIFLATPPVEAHRNRITYLTQMLRDEVVPAWDAGKRIRIFNLGCGPAKEIQDFLANYHICDCVDFSLFDFNDETLQYTSKLLTGLKSEHERKTGLQFTKKSVQQILKDAPRLEKSLGKFDVVYCAGLFDYLSDTVCEKLIEFFYQIVTPGGLVVATNVADINPSRGWMEYMLDWHLIYRNVEQFRQLAPAGVSPDQVSVRAVGTGVNIVVEIRKPKA